MSTITTSCALTARISTWKSPDSPLPYPGIGHDLSIRALHSRCKAASASGVVSGVMSAENVIPGRAAVDLVLIAAISPIWYEGPPRLPHPPPQSYRSAPLLWSPLLSSADWPSPFLARSFHPERR